MKPTSSTVVGLSFLLLGLTALSGNAQLTVNVGTFQLQPDTPDQIVLINVSGVDSAGGLDFFVQVSDGYPNVPGSTGNGPNITSVDIVTGTLFGSNNDGGQLGSGLGLQHQYRGVLTASGTVSGSGLLATIKIDTTGFSEGTWALNVKSVYQGPTLFYDGNLAPITANITDGFITVVPEPAAYEAVAGVLLLSSAILRRAYRSARGIA